MNVLVVNAGSSSLRLRLLNASDEVVGRRDIAGREGGFADGEVAEAVHALVSTVSPTDPRSGASPVDAVGHRVVHGGARFTSAVVLDGSVRQALEALTPLAPLHQPPALAGIDAISKALPEVPAVACFDTAFHATLPPPAATYAVPTEWRDRYGLRRFGFHGLSHAYACRRAASLLERDVAGMRLVTCHLGAGASLAAVHSGRSVDTTMGFTPLEGLVMATRSGSVDPGLLLWVQEQEGLSAAEVGDALEHRSGLQGLAGTADMRAVIAARNAGDQAALLALGTYLHRLRGSIAAMAAALEGVDAVAFTGGVGENAPTVRAGAIAGLEFLGLALNQGLNAAARGDAVISADGATAATVVVSAREDVEIAGQVRELLGDR